MKNDFKQVHWILMEVRQNLTYSFRFLNHKLFSHTQFLTNFNIRNEWMSLASPNTQFNWLYGRLVSSLFALLHILVIFREVFAN